MTCRVGSDGKGGAFIACSRGSMSEGKATVADCRGIAETEKAILVLVDDEETWIPKSEEDSDDAKKA